MLKPKKKRWVLVDKIIYEVIEECGKEVCILQIFDYADGLKRQIRIWTDKYESVPSLKGE